MFPGPNLEPVWSVLEEKEEEKEEEEEEKEEEEEVLEGRSNHVEFFQRTRV